VVEADPPLIVTLAGTRAAELVLLSATTAFPDEAAPSVIVHLTVVPPVTLALSREIPASGVTTSKVPEALMPFAVAVTLAWLPCAEDVATAVNDPFVKPAVTVTADGTLTAALSLASVTVVALVGSGALKVMLPTELWPASS